MNIWWGELLGVVIEMGLWRFPLYIKNAILKARYDAGASLEVLIIAFNKDFNRSPTTTTVPTIHP